MSDVDPSSGGGSQLSSASNAAHDSHPVNPPDPQAVSSSLTRRAMTDKSLDSHLQGSHSATMKLLHGAHEGMMKRIHEKVDGKLEVENWENVHLRMLKSFHAANEICLMNQFQGERERSSKAKAMMIRTEKNAEDELAMLRRLVQAQTRAVRAADRINRRVVTDTTERDGSHWDFERQKEVLQLKHLARMNKLQDDRGERATLVEGKDVDKNRLVEFHNLGT